MPTFSLALTFITAYYYSPLHWPSLCLLSSPPPHSPPRILFLLTFVYIYGLLLCTPKFYLLFSFFLSVVYPLMRCTWEVELNPFTVYCVVGRKKKVKNPIQVRAKPPTCVFRTAPVHATLIANYCRAQTVRQMQDSAAIFINIHEADWLLSSGSFRLQFPLISYQWLFLLLFLFFFFFFFHPAISMYFVFKTTTKDQTI